MGRWLPLCLLALLCRCAGGQQTDAPRTDGGEPDLHDAAPSVDGGFDRAAAAGTWGSDCDDTHALRAHAPGDESSPYHLTPDMNDAYVCFYFAAPWGEAEVQALEFRTALDQTAVVHHWLLYATDDLPAPPGTVRQCLGFDGINTLVTGWAPGRDDLRMPDDVGLQLPSGANAGLILQIHYYAAGRDALDTSGLEFCTTSSFREHTASISWLGTTMIELEAGVSAAVSSACQPESAEPIHILRTWPHMHGLGTRLQSIVRRADGSRDVMLDVPFDFDAQASYPTPLTLAPGDRIETTCHYVNNTDATVVFGEHSGQEMCWALTYAYPANRLRGGAMFADRNFCVSPLL